MISRMFVLAIVVSLFLPIRGVYSQGPSERTYLVYGLTSCAGCAAEILKAVQKIPGVESASFPDPTSPAGREPFTLVVVYRDYPDDQAVIRAVEGVRSGIRCELAPQ